jgi:outer membrane lipoprotein-sorting protein
MVLPAMMLAAALTGTPPASTSFDPLTSAIEHYRTIDSYRVTIRSIHDGEEQHIRYSYKKPGFVRMEFIRPHDGALLIYNPDTQHVRVWPFGAGHFPDVSLSPTNPLIQSLSGIRVDHSDVGVLFENLRILREGGNTEVLGEQNMDGRTVLHLVVTGAEGIAVARVHRSELWLDTTSQFPVKIISRDLRDAVIESVKMEELEINITLPETQFNP